MVVQFDYDAYLKEPLPFSKQLGKYFSPRENMTIFDIGSCEGEDSIRLKKRFPNASVYTFEPLPDNVAKIKKNFAKYGHPADKIFQIALSDKNAKAEFYVSSGHPDHLPKTDDWDFGNKSSSLLAPKEHTKTLEWIKFNKNVEVETVRLDTFCIANAVDSIDFIYMDVQGAELLVLEGAGKILQNVKAVWLEVEAIELYDKQPLKNDVEEFMAKHHFVRVMDTVDKISGDQLYIEKKLYEVSSNNAVSKIVSRIKRRSW